MSLCAMGWCSRAMVQGRAKAGGGNARATAER